MLLVGYVYVYLFIPETKGLTLEEVRSSLSQDSRPCSLIDLVYHIQVDELYRSGVKPWNSTGWKPHLSEEAHLKVHGRQMEKASTEKSGVDEVEEVTKV